MNEKQLYIIRHGETDFNRKGIVQGRGMDTALNATGREQAAAFYAAYRHIPFDQVYTSALVRTAQTVQSFIEAGLPVQKMAGLDEFNWGLFEGRAFGEFHQDYNRLVHSWKQGEYATSPPQGESPLEVAARQKPVIQLLENNPAKTLLVCMHGRAMRLLLCLLLGRPYAEMDQFEHSNLSLYQLSYSAGQWTLLKANDTAHLSLL
jgi:probable phosphoglycerate mutase